MPPDPKFKTGALPTPPDILAAASPFRPVKAVAMDKHAYVPAQLSVWANDRYGVCVTSESAFAAACAKPLIMVSDAEVIRWARSHGILNGAYLEQVLRWMKESGLKVGGQVVGNGGYYTVDYRDEAVLRTAICIGPISIAIASASLPSGAGNQQGWYVLSGGASRRTDHCVSLCGHGPAKWLYEQLGVPLPAAVPPTEEGYLLFTWGTIGFVTHRWLMGTCVEAWVRNPTNVVTGSGPIPPNPGPPHEEEDPDPPPPPPPPGSNALVLTTALPPGTYEIGSRTVADGITITEADLKQLKLALSKQDGSQALPILQIMCMLLQTGALNWLPAPILAIFAALCAQQEDCC